MAWLTLDRLGLSAAIVMTQNTVLRDKRIDHPGEIVLPRVAPFMASCSSAPPRFGLAACKFRGRSFDGQERRQAFSLNPRAIFAKPDWARAPTPTDGLNSDRAGPVAPEDLVGADGRCSCARRAEHRRHGRQRNLLRPPPQPAPPQPTGRSARWPAISPARRCRHGHARPQSAPRPPEPLPPGAPADRGRRRARHDRMRRGAARWPGRAMSASAPAKRASAKSCSLILTGPLARHLHFRRRPAEGSRPRARAAGAAKPPAKKKDAKKKPAKAENRAARDRAPLRAVSASGRSGGFQRARWRRAIPLPPWQSLQRLARASSTIRRRAPDRVANSAPSARWRRAC